MPKIVTFSRQAVLLAAASLWAVTFTQSAALGREPLDREVYIHPHEMVAVEGARRLNLFCIGKGQPTVLFDSGTGGDSLNWRDVQGEVAGFTRSCSYDRAGYGFSDPATRPSDARNTVDDLHRLIQSAHLGRSVVLVGHSAGGLYATLYAATYPDDTGGLVLVDPGFAGQYKFEWSRLSSVGRKKIQAAVQAFVAGSDRCLVIFRAGGRARLEHESPNCLDDPPNPDPVLHQELNRQYATASYLEANVSEIDSLFATKGGESVDGNQVSVVHKTLGSIPLIVLTAWPHPTPVSDLSAEDKANYAAGWKEGHERLAAMSTAGSDVLVLHSGHEIQNDQPDVLLRAVRRIVDEVRAR